MADHLFGLPALRLPDREAVADQLIAGRGNGELASSPRIQLAIAFFRKDQTLFSGLHQQGIVAPEMWDVMETSIIFGIWIVSNWQRHQFLRVYGMG